MGIDLLYKYEKKVNKDDLDSDRFPYSIIVKSVGKSISFQNENFSLHLLLSRLMYFCLSSGRARIVYVYDGNKVVHTSFVVPKCSKYSFLGKNDYEIGPCKTDINYRGRGIYPHVLKYVVKHFSKQDNDFYMIVDKKNTSSRRGCEKAGFFIQGEVERTKYLHIWKYKENR